TSVGPEPGLPVDADLRPEGRNGPLVRSFESYVEYYDRWSSPWEAQALLRARALSGTLSVVAAGGPDEGAGEAALADRAGAPAAEGTELDLGPGAAGGRSLGARFTRLIHQIGRASGRE